MLLAKNGDEWCKNCLSASFVNASFDYNWTIEVGKEFARDLYARGFASHNDAEYDNHYLWDVFAKGYDSETLLSSSLETPTLDRFEAPSECVVCMSNPPTTTVQPCGHRVACQECSNAMNEPGSQHRLICVMCRSPITNIVSYI
jgi:hypothetical protein